MKTYIRVDHHDGGGMFYKGQFKSLGDAVVSAMRDMDEHADSYREEGDYYHLDPMYLMDGEAAYCIQVHYKSRHWAHEIVDQYYFLEGDDE